MRSVPSATVAVNDGAAAATGAAAIEVTRAASATPPSNVFLVMSCSPAFASASSRRPQMAGSGKTVRRPYAGRS